MIKKIKHHIAIPLTHICNLSFNTGVFPSELKVANVEPIFKFGDEMLFSNYRPVSLLPVFSKIYERLMYNRLTQFINDNNLWYNFQFGSQRGKSTHMTLIVLLDKISEALDKGEYVIGVFFLDYSKAFDTVNHSILLKKLDCMAFVILLLNGFKTILRTESNMWHIITLNRRMEKSTVECHRDPS